MVKSLWVIKDESTNTWCYSSKHMQFDTGFDVVVTFEQQENAEKAVKEMNKRKQFPENYGGSSTYYVDGESVSLSTADFQVVECTLKVIE